MDESNATCGKRLDSIGLENTEANRQAYRELLVTTPGLGQYISGAILFEETLYQKTSTGSTMVDELNKQGIVPGWLLPMDLNRLMFYLAVQSVCLLVLALCKFYWMLNVYHSLLVVNKHPCNCCLTSLLGGFNC